MNKTLEFFKRTHSKNRLNHLYLINGDLGTGKTKLAYEISYMLLKEYNKSSKLKESIYNNNNAQVYFIEPDGLSIKKQQILNLQEEFSKTTLLEGPRIYIIKDMDLISSSAANSLLKFMEEPESSKVYGLLLTTNIANILPTIISRSQVIKLQSLNPEIIKQRLIDKGVSERLATNISYTTKSIDEGLLYSESEEYKKMIAFLEKLLTIWPDPSKSLSLLFVEELQFLNFERKMYETLLELMLIYFLDIIKYKTNQKYSLTHLKEILHKVNYTLSIKQLENITKAIQDEIVKQSYYINVSLSLDALALRLEKSR